MEKQWPYDAIIVGGGIAGLQAAIQLGRYEHRVLVVDAGYGRSTLCRMYHNLLGWPDGVSGEELRSKGQAHAAALGVEFVQDEAMSAEKDGQLFQIGCKELGAVRAHTLLLATGILDRFPPLPRLEPCLGMTVYVCPDCDGFEVKNKRTIVLGAGNAGAHMAYTLTYWTKDLIYINHERKTVDEELSRQLQEAGIQVVEEAIGEVLTAGDGQFRGIRLESGRVIEGERGFIAFGGNKVRSELAHQLGLERLENRHIVTDWRTKETSVPGVWAAGDIAVHAEQVSVAMGEGSLAAIWMHKKLLKIRHHNKQPVGAT